ncbi:uncharacterized protein LODBEIA_P34760 [Lodderomyces beijingensis]|uniref:EamA domain-containing protein n=1 Tax=Lodderomyces beijingensis TaxID=1775926 RepID=A0ABP0ZM86_9ASCO
MSLCQFVSQMGRDWKYDRVQMKDEERLGSPGRYGSDDNLSDEQQQEGQEQQQQQQPHCSHLSCVVSKGSQDLDLDLDLDLDSNSACALDVNTYETFKLSLQFIILWFSANLVTNASLSYTSVASQTILSSTSSFFTLIIGYLVSVEQINKNKVAGILLSFAGVLIVTKVDTASDNPNNGPATSTFLIFIGNSLALVGALIYGVYTILLKLKISTPNSHKERNLNTHLFFGYVGLICLLGLWPILVILHITGVEKFELPQSSLMTEILITNAAITFISDFCWCNAVLLTSPLTVTVGLSMTIPLAMVGDWIFKKFQLNLLYIFGALIVTTGFLIINKDEEEDFVVSE